MNTKEMIEFLDREYKYLFCDEEDKYDELITLLKENEKYKKIVEEIDERLMPGKVNAVECPDYTNMGELSTLDFVRLIIKDIKKKYFPEPKECEEVLILTVKGKEKEVKNVVFNIEHVFRNAAHVNVKRGTRAENVQES